MNPTSQNIHLEIVQQCQTGNRQAQHQLYKLYSKAMYNICYRITNDEWEAEDVLQEAFVNAFQHINSYRGTASFGAWLKKIVVNKAISHVRKKRLEIVPLDNHREFENNTPEVDEEALFLNIEKIRQAVQMLPDGYRLVFSLYLLEGYDHGEIAEILNITESTSKSQYNRSKKKLKEILKEEVFHNG